MTKILIFQVIAALLSATSMTPAKEMPLVSPALAGMSEAVLARLDGKLEQLIADKKMAGCVVAVARKGQLAYFKAFGMADTEEKVAMGKDTIFRIFSMTKGITSAAALMLVDEGKIALDDPVSKHLPQLKDLEVYSKKGNQKAEREMTVRDLLRHTSGLGYGWTGEAVDKMYGEKGVMGGSLEEMVERLGGIPLHYQPGKNWQYSVSSDVLGRVVEVASGKSLDTFFRERLFQPLDMRDTGFQLPKEKTGRFSANYAGGSLKIIEKPGKSKYLETPKMLSGGGGLVSTTRDYMRFLQMIANGGEFEGKRYLKKETVDLMTTNQLPDEIPHIAIGLPRPGVGFGLGFSVRYKDTTWDPDARIGEYGWGGAASTHYWVSPKDELVVVAMQQQMPFSFALELGIKKLIYDAVENKDE